MLKPAGRALIKGASLRVIPVFEIFCAHETTRSIAAVWLSSSKGLPAESGALGIFEAISSIR